MGELAIIEVTECAKNEHLNWPDSYRLVYRRRSDGYYHLETVCGKCSSSTFTHLDVKTMTRWAHAFCNTTRYLKEDLPEGAISVTEMKKQNKDWK